MPCLFAAFDICHRSHSPLCSLFQIPKPTKIQVKIAQLILLPLLQKTGRSSRDSICLFYKLMTENGNRWKAKRELQHIAISPQPFNHHIPIILLDEQNIVLSPQNVFLETFVRQDDVLKALVFGISIRRSMYFLPTVASGEQRNRTSLKKLVHTSGNSSPK